MALDYFSPASPATTVTIEPDGDGGVIVTIPLRCPRFEWESFGLGLTLLGIARFLAIRRYFLPAFLLHWISLAFIAWGSIHLVISLIRRVRAHPSIVLGITKESFHINSPGFLGPLQIHAPRCDLQHVEAVYRDTMPRRRLTGVAFHFMNRPSVFVSIERPTEEVATITDALIAAGAATVPTDKFDLV